MGCGLTIKDGNGVVVQPSLTTPPLTDNSILRADGPDGKYQDSQVSIDDSGNMSILQSARIDLNSAKTMSIRAAGASTLALEVGGNDVQKLTATTLSGESVLRLTNFIGHDKLVDAYDGTGGQTINGTAATVNIDTTRTNTDSNVFAIASDVVTVTQSGDGTAIIDYRVTIGTTGSGDFQFEVWLEQNNSEIAGSRVRAGKGT